MNEILDFFLKIILYGFSVDVLTEEVLTNPSKNEDANQDGYVSIDGRKTYFDLFPTNTQIGSQSPNTVSIFLLNLN